MGSTSWDEILEKLSKDKKLTEEFLAIYPDGWTEKMLQMLLLNMRNYLLHPIAHLIFGLKVMIQH